MSTIQARHTFWNSYTLRTSQKDIFYAADQACSTGLFQQMVQIVAKYDLTSFGSRHCGGAADADGGSNPQIALSQRTTPAPNAPEALWAPLADRNG